jgi:hypothetical protein
MDDQVKLQEEQAQRLFNYYSKYDNMPDNHRAMIQESKYVIIVATISLFFSFFNLIAIVFIMHEINKVM